MILSILPVLCQIQTDTSLYPRELYTQLTIHIAQQPEHMVRLSIGGTQQPSQSIQVTVFLAQMLALFIAHRIFKCLLL